MVILMGVRKLQEITLDVSKYRCSMTPIAIIQNGTMENESCHISTLGNSIRVLPDIDKSEPGIIVIGDVVSEHPSFFQEEVQRVLHSGL